MSVFLVDLLGWVGAVLLLAAYGLVSARRLEGDALAYQLPNLAGGLLRAPPNRAQAGHITCQRR